MRIKEILEDAERTFVNPLYNEKDQNLAFRVWNDMDEIEYSLVELHQTPKDGEWPEAINIMRNQYGNVEDVPINNVVGTEPTLEKGHLDAVTGGKALHASSKLPILYKVGNQYVVGDGNHRVTADYLNNKTTTRALVLDFDKLSKLVDLDDF